MSTPEKTFESIDDYYSYKRKNADGFHLRIQRGIQSPAEYFATVK